MFISKIGIGKSVLSWTSGADLYEFEDFFVVGVEGHAIVRLKNPKLRAKSQKLKVESHACFTYNS
jgi:hypothetical protein